MTVPSTVNKWIYTGNDDTEFAYTTKIYADTDLIVEKLTIATGAIETLTLTTDYTVSGAGSDDGGTVVLETAISSSYKLIIRKVLPATQEVEPVENDPNRAEVFEEALDRQVMIAQQLQEAINRTVQRTTNNSTPLVLGDVTTETDETKFSHKLPILIGTTTYYIMLTNS